MADAARDEADEHLACARLRELDVLHDQRPAEFLEHCGANLHAAASHMAVQRRGERPPNGRSISNRPRGTTTAPGTEGRRDGT